jgi:hypothetical protein
MALRAHLDFAFVGAPRGTGGGLALRVALLRDAGLSSRRVTRPLFATFDSLPFCSRLPIRRAPNPDRGKPRIRHRARSSASRTGCPARRSSSRYRSRDIRRT